MRKTSVVKRIQKAILRKWLAYFERSLKVGPKAHITSSYSTKVRFAQSAAECQFTIFAKFAFLSGGSIGTSEFFPLSHRGHSQMSRLSREDQVQKRKQETLHTPIIYQMLPPREFKTAISTLQIYTLELFITENE